MIKPSPFIIVPLEALKKKTYRFRAITSKFLGLFPSLKYNLRALGVEDADAYVLSAILSSLILASLFSLIMLVGLINSVYEKETVESIIEAFVIMFILFLGVNLIYPSVKVKSVAITMDRDLIFALKDILVQLESGMSLYEAMVNIAKSDYKHVSEEFAYAVKKISAGTPETQALQILALETKSEYFRKALWQLIASLEGGASLKPALQNIINTLNNYQHQSVKKYGATLNFLVLIYMLIAAALPSMILTFLIVISLFGGYIVNLQFELVVMGIFFLLQIILIGYMKSNRPIVYG